jgi:branched-chain amino acid transport system permease protein
MCIGAYAAVLARIHYNAPVWLTFAIAVLAAAVGGALLGLAAARLSGPYLAGTTLALAIGLPSIANRFGSVFKGDEGLQVDVGYPPEWFVNTFGDPSYEMWQFYVALPFALISLFFASNLLLSRSGRVWRSIRDHEIASALTGVKVSRQKVFVFTISAAFAGLAGALYGLRGSVGPSTYPTSLSLMLLTGAILGGIRSIAGAFIGSVLVVFLPDWIDYAVHSFELSEQVSNYLPALVGGILLILTVVINPAGVAGGNHLHKHK